MIVDLTKFNRIKLMSNGLNKYKEVEYYLYMVIGLTQTLIWLFQRFYEKYIYSHRYKFLFRLVSTLLIQSQ